MIAVIYIKLIGLLSFSHLILMSVHTQCSTSRAHSLCTNPSNETYLRDRKNENNFLYYHNKSNVTEDELNSIQDNTTVIFCTKAVMQQEVIQIANKTNIALYGLLGVHTEVCCCGNESGYRFINVTNLTLSNISFINCGSPATSLDTQGTTVTTLFSGIFFYFCENVTLTNINIRNSTGTGVAFVDTVGRVEINDSSFENNNYFHNKYSFSYGVYVKFSSGNIYKNHSLACMFVFHKDNFINNSVPSYQNPKIYLLYNDNETSKVFKLGGGLTLQFEDSDSWYIEKVVRVTNCTFELNAGHRGGGMSLNFTNSTTRNSVTIKYCNFMNNNGDFGGGLSVIFSNNPYNNCVLLSHVHFSKNQAGMGGGAMELDFHFQSVEYPETNNVSFKNCTTVANRAKYGGRTALHYSRAKLATQNYIIKFINCTWEVNKALFGSAVEASVHASDKLASGYVMSPVFKDCQFMSNFRLEKE